MKHGEGNNRNGPPIRYPRRRAVRWTLRQMARLAFFLISDLKIEGRENIPETGPAILVANHFHYADPVAVMRLSRRQIEFVGGNRFFVGPKYLHALPKLWGFIPAFRGGYSRSTLEAALAVLEQGGLVALFPEGGAWSQVLRPARPGAAYLAHFSGARIIPVGLSGFEQLFASRRPSLSIRIGKPIGPFVASGGAKERRRQFEETGEKMMRAIARLIPDKYHGVFSEDPLLRAEAQKVAAFPFEQEGMRGM
jgi:1-acyl-sn-glycerol-3-phosphate acyltransferase